ncbi:MAG: hypothetical protein GF320_16485 [Armatimonadia bacterium]|nr:hypothetical protein [Armatimonadia bacterium]
MLFWRKKDGAADEPMRPDTWVDWTLEVAAYVLIAVSLASRSYSPELAHAPLTLAVVHVAVIPPLLMRGRTNALILSRIAVAIALGMLIHQRLPIELQALRWESPRHEVLTVSLTGLVIAAMAAALAGQQIRSPEPSPEPSQDRRFLAGVTAVTTGLVLLFILAMWLLINGVMVATTEPEGRFYAESIGAACMVAQVGVLVVYALTANSVGRVRRLALVAGIAMAVRHYLPPSGGL